MARSKIGQPTNDLISDSGAVLWSFVKGEQLEYPALMNFLQDATDPGYTFEAVVIEAENVEGQLDRPTTVKTGGKQTKLNVRRQNFRGQWAPNVAYNFEDVVVYNGLCWKLLAGVGRMSALTPDLDEWFEETTLNVVYLQFPMSLAADWSQQPAVGSPVYGFFELRVTEPNNAVFAKTWKPIRGMVEINFSPTDVVPD